jgi:hypothetical protein
MEVWRGLKIRHKAYFNLEMLLKVDALGVNIHEGCRLGVLSVYFKYLRLMCY